MKQKIKLLRSLIVCISLFSFAYPATAQYGSYDIVSVSGNYAFSLNQTPGHLVSVNPNLGGNGLVFQWEQSARPIDGFTAVPGATYQTYTFAAPLTQTTYFRRKLTIGAAVFYSNILKIELVSVNWENLNYVREHDVLIQGVTTWTAIDNLPIGQKLQTTTYLDGTGRPLQKISKETSTRDGSNLWGDMVKFYKYDALGRQPLGYLPYNTATETGKYKTDPVTEQGFYYSLAYNETSTYSIPTYDNSPLNRILNIKSSGTSWAAGSGNSTAQDVNDIAENVQIFTIGFTAGALPVSQGAYPSNALYKISSINENGKQVIEYINKSGQSILTKVQLANKFQGLTIAHDGWICTYSIYDDFGLLRYRFQPEAVKWLDAHSWSFTGTDGQKVLDELCFRYEYDDKGRTILKKAPGAKELYMIYDKRDRVVFMQDGNQRAKSPVEWTANIYDELDRAVITTLYHTSKTIANLQADIDNAGNVGSVTVSAQSVTTATYNNPITNSDLNNSSVTAIVKYNFYDDYSYSGAKVFNTNFDNLQAYPTGGDPIAPTQRTTSMPTGGITRVLNTNTFLTGSVYYDDKGRTIQSTEDNIKAGTDVITLQYQWDGRELSSNTKHTTANTGYTNFSIITKNSFDKLGRVTRIEKKYGSNAFKPIADYVYDDMGRLKSKKLDPGYNAGLGHGSISGLENLEYSYNIHNDITGINKNYALKTPGLYNKWDNYFGLYLGYDNRDNVFTNAQLDGHVTGLLWNTQGDDAQRKYDFTYDNAGRLTNAVFKERQTTSTSWSNTKMDFSVTGTNGKIEYDLNGNLLTMIQKGVLPGATSPYNVDDLQYSYANLSNKLMRVTDAGTLGATNGKLGDFADGTNSADDYTYDDNGNLIIDLNKNAVNTGNTAGIKYNFLDKPEEVHITGKGTITMVYDADGNKLQKTFTPEGTSNTKTTTYINEFIYEGDNLQYINFEEGRIRVMQSVSQNNGFDILTIDGNADLPGGKRGAYDYFLRDYQGNVRMILTEETHLGSNSCTMELARAANEEPIFGQLNDNGLPSAENEVAARFAVSNIPGQGTKGGGWQDPNINNYVSRIGNLAQSKMGPNSLLKVMSGDKISATTIYYYQNPVVNTSGSNSLLTDLLKALGNTISGSPITSGTVKAASSNIATQLSGSTPFINATSPNAGSSSGNNPKAYLTILFFDERFNFVEENSQALRVQQSGTGAPALVLTNIKAPKNGYAFVYVSNEANEMVYFDNLQVTHDRCRIIEEDHYYAYGLKIAGISSKKLPDASEGHIDNKDLYNDKELIDDADLDWYDYGFRSYDAQIGRFIQLDPLTDSYPYLTPYQYASCEPIGNIDVDGLEGAGVTAVKTLSEVIVSNAPRSINTIATIGGGLARAGLSSTINVTSSLMRAMTSGIGANQVGGKIIIKDAVSSNPSLMSAIEYVKQTKEFKDIFEQFTNGSLGNTDFVFDITSAADAAGHSGVFANSTQWTDNDFSWEISEYIQQGAVDAADLSTGMSLQVKLQFGKYDKRNATDVGYNVETITHEFILHILQQIEIIKYLRSGAPMQSVIDKWYKETQPGGTMNSDKQHVEFIKPDSRLRKKFNTAIRGVLNKIKSILHKKQLNKAISDDINVQKSNYKTK